MVGPQPHSLGQSPGLQAGWWEVGFPLHLLGPPILEAVSCPDTYRFSGDANCQSMAHGSQQDRVVCCEKVLGKNLQIQSQCARASATIPSRRRENQLFSIIFHFLSFHTEIFSSKNETFNLYHEDTQRVERKVFSTLLQVFCPPLFVLFRTRNKFPWKTDVRSTPGILTVPCLEAHQQSGSCWKQGQMVEWKAGLLARIVLC